MKAQKIGGSYNTTNAHCIETSCFIYVTTTILCVCLWVRVCVRTCVCV